MLRYLTKFLLDIAPPVAATVIGAFIVTHYINPKDTAAQPKTEAAAPADTASRQPLNGANGMSPRNVEQVAVKPTADEAAETKKSEKPASAKPVVRQAVAAPRVEEKPSAEDRREPAREAADLARAALERLRNQAPAETSRPPAHAAAQPVPAPATPALVPASAPASPPAVAAAPAPAALPPPIVISPQREAPSPLFGEPSRLTPPAEIPVRSADASTVPGEGRSIIGGIASAAKSIVDVVVPR